MGNEKPAVQYGFYYSYEEDKEGSFTYRYPYCFIVDENILSSVRKTMTLLNDERGFIVANAKFKSGVLYLKYPFSKEKHYLFSSIFCREYEYEMPDGRKIQRKKIGDFNYALTADQKLKILSELCRLFHKLNTLQIYIRNFDENIFIFDLTNMGVYIDILPAMLPYTASQQRFMEQMHPAYYLASPNRIGGGEYGEGSINTNNFFLNAIAYKLISGDELLGNMRYVDIIENFEKRNLFIDTEKNGLFSDFMEKLQLSLIIKQPKRLPFMTEELKEDIIKYQYPNVLNKTVAGAACVCGNGVFGLGNDAMICPGCGKECFGFVTMRANSKRVLLVGASKESGRLFSTDYSPSLFGISSSRDCIFKVVRGTDSKGNFRCALMFLLQDDVYFIDKETDKWEPYFGFNAQGNRIYTVSDGEDRVSVKIGNDVFDFDFDFDDKG